MTHPQRASRQPLPLTAEEEERFVREMVPVVAASVGAGRTFRISADTEPLQRMFREITSRTSQAMGRPLAGYTNGREFWIEPGEA
ncbi:hypothetical protein [Actinocorallia populi]|uniref:hypothetical protein n=1 Tax=Actinocorallia populi TaxID=2079200 RepID=UPI000D08D81D|nr:hypothetical protein [Actinocorallia populi]